MSEDSTDVSLSEYMYVIGFTENKYYPAKHGSPTPGESRHSSLARGRAERCNKGAEKILSGASQDLERQRRKSVTKIHTDILDLMYELSERRKASSPVPRFRSEFQSIESRLSMLSPPLSHSSRSSSSNSLPIIEVQQLPPLSHPTFTLPSINPEAHNNQFRSTLKRNKCTKLPRVNKDEQRKFSNPISAVSNSNTVSRETIKVTDHIDKGTASNEKRDKQIQKPKPILKRRNAGLQLLEKVNSYVGRYSRKVPSKEKNKINLSYCQCSYGERREKGRIDNVMRRYSSKTKAGPLDFTKLQRQIERSKTMVW